MARGTYFEKYIEKYNTIRILQQNFVTLKLIGMLVRDNNALFISSESL